MIIEIGHFALVLALFLSLIQSVVPMLGANLGKANWMRTGSLTAVSLFGLISISFLSLLYAYALSDFSVQNVVMNSHTMMPMAYKLAAAWGNHEGSMLLWVWMLSLWGFLVAWRGRTLPLPFQARVLSVQGMIGFGFILFILFTSNPFLRLDPPALEGLGLNPVLQDPALAIHPPLLYTGYVGFSIAFCFAMAALLENKVDSIWAARLRPWVLVAWIALTAGIVKGSLWAYYELGWGGFWFWDPVENASLMPWLAGTALLHSVSVLERRDTLKSWTVFLSILAFSFSLLGTFLVRSGILTSVHSFATDPTRGIFILALLTIAIGGAFLIYALRAPAVRPGAGFGLFSRESALLLNNVFLFTFCATVFMGTLYPVFISALDLGSVSVGPPYYTATLLPMLIPFALLMGVAPYIAWQRGDAGTAIKKLGIPFILAALTALAPFLPGLSAKPLAFVGFGLGGWVLWATLGDLLRKGRGMPLSYYGMIVAHAGFAVFIIGVTATTQGTTEKILWMNPGDRTEIAGKTLTFLGTETGLGPDYNADTGVFTVKSGTNTSFISPQKRWYPVAEKSTSETALHFDGFGLLYLVLGDQDAAQPGRWVVRGYYHPLVLWIFGGGFLMYLGGILSACDRKRRAKGG
jgi:cytochrome c-type biogenesis protein CcmF